MMTKTKAAPAWYKLLESVKPFIGVGNGIHRILLWGKKGTGKSSWPIRTADALGVRWNKFVMHKAAVPEDLTGGLLIEPGGATVARPQHAALAFRDGFWTVIDEIDRISADTDPIMHALLDDPSIARLAMADGSVLKPADGYAIFCTTNAEPSVLRDTIQDRFDLILNCNEPAPDVLNGLPDDLRSLLNDQPVEQVNWTPPVTTRSIQAVARLAALPAFAGTDAALAAYFGERVGRQLADSILAKKGGE